MKYFSPLPLLVVCTVLLGACSLSPKKSIAPLESRHLTPQEIVSVTPGGMLMMSPTAEIENIMYANIDDEPYEEAFMVFNSAGCGETDKARLVVMKYDHTNDVWSLLDTFILAGKQGRIESFKIPPIDITGDGKIDLEIASETNWCGGPWTLYKQVLNLNNGKMMDLTNKSIVSVEGGYGQIKRVGMSYEVYARIWGEGQCNPYSITVFTFDGQKFVQEKQLTTTYHYKTKFDLSGATLPDTFSDNCVMVYNNNDKKDSYIRDDAFNKIYPAVVSGK